MSETAFTMMVGVTVPAEQPVNVTTIAVPLEELGDTVHPVAVPLTVKSDVDRPVIASLNVRVNVGDVALVGFAVHTSDDTEGAVRSRVTVAAVTADAGPVFASVSDTVFAPNVRSTVPAEQAVREIVIAEPEEALGAPMTQPVAVPDTEKSAVDSPLTPSLNVTV